MTAEVVQSFSEHTKTGTTPWNYEIAAKDLMYQVGGLMKLIMQMKGERYAHGKTKEEIKIAIADEVSDILANTLFLAHDLNIDVAEAWDIMQKSDKDKVSARVK